MKSILYAALPSDESDPIRFAFHSGDRLETFEHGSPLPLADEVIAIAPATHVAHFCISLAARNERDIQQSALFAIEDELAQPVEDVHLTIGPRKTQSLERDVYVLDKSRLQEWQSILQSQNIIADKILPEQCLISPERCPVFSDDRVITYDQGRFLGVSRHLPHDVLAQMVFPNAIPTENHNISLIDLVREGTPYSQINFLTGEFACRRKHKNDLKAWRLAAGLAICAPLIWFGALFLEAMNQDRAARQTYSEATAIFARIYPDATTPDNISHTARNILSRAQMESGSEFTQLTALLYESMAKLESVQIQSIEYVADTNKLVARLSLPNAQSVQAIRQSITQHGAKVQISEPEGPGSVYKIEMALERKS